MSSAPGNTPAPNKADDAPIMSPFMPAAPRQQPQFQFTLRMLLIVVAVVGVVAAGLAGLLRARNHPQQAMFVIMVVVAAPLVLMGLFSGAIGFVRWITNPENRKRW